MVRIKNVRVHLLGGVRPPGGEPPAPPPPPPPPPQLPQLLPAHIAGMFAPLIFNAPPGWVPPANLVNLFAPLLPPNPNAPRPPPHGGSKASAFIARMMGEVKLKHAGKYAKPTSPLAPSSKMRAPRAFDLKRLANAEQNGVNSKQYGASPFLLRHFGNVTETKESKAQKDARDRKFQMAELEERLVKVRAKRKAMEDTPKPPKVKKPAPPASPKAPKEKKEAKKRVTKQETDEAEEERKMDKAIELHNEYTDAFGNYSKYTKNGYKMSFPARAIGTTTNLRQLLFNIYKGKKNPEETKLKEQLLKDIPPMIAKMKADTSRLTFENAIYHLEKQLEFLKSLP
jgi:hypothetical protein